MSITIKDIARHAGVSTATVSNALTGKKHVSTELKQKVLSAIDELGYRPNVYARILKTNRSHIIGVHVPDLSNPFFGEGVKAVQSVAEKAGYQIVLYDSDNDIQNEERNVQSMLDANLDGIISIAPRMDISELIAHVNVPLIIIDHPSIPTKRNVAFVFSDNYKGSASITNYLVKHGYKRFYYVAGPTKIVANAKVRLEGFKDTIKQHGLPDESYHIVYGDFTFASGYELMTNLMENYDLSPEPTVAIIGSDIMAWGAMEAIKDKKLKIPKDIGIVGYDNIYFSSFLFPKLTTVENPINQMSIRAMRLMLDALEKQKKLEGMSVILESSLVVRDSC
ncbi:MAG: LacI family transcriptional regulator [Clostridiales bacterium]|nr:LacI family transcriptional regulator [Clostridiales bacterium]